MGVDLSIIIVNYNVKEFLENALISIKKAIEGINAEIFVVDNASEDGSVEMIKQKFPDVNLIANSENLGFAKANNQALKLAKGKYILLINPDTIVQEDTFRVLLSFLESHPECGMVGCKVLNPDGTLQLACRRSFPTPWVAFTKMIGLSSLFPKSKIFAKYNLTYLDPDEVAEVDAVSGSFMMIRREVYEKVGGLDEDFFMYGEDIDWCYRIKKAGWKIYYVPFTQIIHFKGESTKRSNIDEIRVFYEAMKIFVRKHYKEFALLGVILRVGIFLRGLVALLGKFIKNYWDMLVDLVIVLFSFLAGEFIRFGQIFALPKYAYPEVLIVPPLITIFSLYAFGVYTNRKFSIGYSVIAVWFSALVLSSLTFFLKEYAFSRMIVLMMTLLNTFLIPLWRLLLRILGKIPFVNISIVAKRVLIVGTGANVSSLIKKLKNRTSENIKVVGVVDYDLRRVGEKIDGVEIIGSISSIEKIIRERKINDVIFLSDEVPYSQILSVISRVRDRSVNFKLALVGSDLILSKASIDTLDDIPVLDIDYNVNKFLNRFAKRVFDIIFTIPLLIFVYPLVYLKKFSRKKVGNFDEKILLLPKVLSGKLSLVGRPLDSPDEKNYLGKKGLTGIVQISDHENLSEEEIERLNIFYARNQSLALDIEILIRTLINLIKNKGHF
ncbi:glycosyltransferase [Candidatus Chrysopegis kryptomonas]|uniref:Glycosyltransferase, GT2 family n=1 Tax=Candidatus Chryseopegocella kryptomonas TaxID=1633643 RepID=A0A0P1NVE9_9BACT|nr:glycosyltransferase [Candidatus Chrysopegis kryptomonas]CUT02914.1 Glycosyltransferase, GT2 family [Candidatus Chrysopegis kryptomonas]